MNPDGPTPRRTPPAALRPPSAPGDRLVRLADLLGECPPPGMAGGCGQCAHGTWPCVITQAAWLAHGREPSQQARMARQEPLPSRQAQPEAAAGEARDVSARPPRVTGVVAAVGRKLSDRLHAAADDRARAAGWQITPTPGRFGLTGRRYHDPRFAARSSRHD